MSWAYRFPEKAADFIVTRYPLWVAFSLLMMISDQQDGELAPLPARLLYANIGMTLFCGFTLSMSHHSSKMALIFTGQLGYQCYNMFTNPQYKLEQWLRNRLALRNLGLMSVYVLYAFYHDLKSKKVHNRTFNFVGHLLMAAFLGGMGYLMRYTPDERQAFLHHVADEENLMNIIFGTFVILAGLFLSRKLVNVSVKAALVLLALYSFYIDCDVTFWAAKGVPFWTQIRIISDNVGIMAGLLMVEVQSQKRKIE